MYDYWLIYIYTGRLNLRILENSSFSPQQEEFILLKKSNKNILKNYTLNICIYTLIMFDEEDCEFEIFKYYKYISTLITKKRIYVKYTFN